MDGKPAISQLVREAADFVACTFQDYSDPGDEVAVVLEESRRWMDALAEDLDRNVPLGKAVSSGVLGKCFHYTNRLYHVARRREVRLDCEQHWQHLVFCVIVTYDLA